MASSRKPRSRNLHECCLCLSKSKNVVTIPCGHNCCRSCTDGLIGKYERTGSYSCQQCSQTFSTKPDQDGPVDQLVDKFKETDLHTGTSADSAAGPSSSGLTRPSQELKETALQIRTTADTPTSRPEDVACVVCTDHRQKAVKSCMTCLASYCDPHLRLHNDLHARASHSLVDATDQLRAMICPVHGKVLEVYCRKENQRICCMCVLEDHKGHDMVAAGQVEKKVRRTIMINKNNYYPLKVQGCPPHTVPVF